MGQHQTLWSQLTAEAPTLAPSSSENMQAGCQLGVWVGIFWPSTQLEISQGAGSLTCFESNIGCRPEQYRKMLLQWYTVQLRWAPWGIIVEDKGINLRPEVWVLNAFMGLGQESLEECHFPWLIDLTAMRIGEAHFPWALKKAWQGGAVSMWWLRAWSQGGLAHKFREA